MRVCNKHTYTVELSVCGLKDVSYLALEPVKPVFDRAGLSAAHSGEWFIVRPSLHGDTKTRSGPLYVCVVFFPGSPVVQSSIYENEEKQQGNKPNKDRISAAVCSCLEVN